MIRVYFRSYPEYVTSLTSFAQIQNNYVSYYPLEVLCVLGGDC